MRPQVALAMVPSSPQLRAVAATQLSDTTMLDGTLTLAAREATPCLRAALQLRRWSPSVAPDLPTPALALVVAEPGDGPGEATDRARELARLAPPGRIVAEPEVLAAADLPWLAATPAGITERPQAVDLHWAGSGRAEPFELPLPAPILNSLDRPWAMLGRDRELDAIARRWADAVDGRGSLHLIAGEPGAGKTRLVAEAAREIHVAGGLVLYGSGEGPAAAPFSPFAQAVSQLARHGGELGDRVRDSPLWRLVREPSGADLRRTGSLGDESGALFGAAVSELERLSSVQPLLLMIEDLHACAPSSLRLLEHLARPGWEMRVLVLTTYRATDLDSDDERTSLVARLRSVAADHLELSGLGTRSLSGVAAALDPQADAPALERTAARAREETEGNALFACELLRGAGEGGGGPREIAAPRSLRMLIASRARGLGEDAFDHLCAAAVAGRVFDPELIADALGASHSSLLESVGLGERAGLLTIDPGDGSCSFTHSITMRSLRDEVGPAQRGPLHRRLAEALERSPRRRSAEAVEQLAHHFEWAEPPALDRAAHYCRLTGERALEGHDHETAAAWFEHALELDRRSGAGDERERCRLLIGLGTALRPTGEPRFREVLLEAARIADRIGDVELLTAAVLSNHRGFVSLVGGFDRERIALLERAAERISERGPDLAMVLAQLALELTFSAEPPERRHELAARALEIARETETPLIVSRVLIRALIAGWGPGNARHRVAAAEESIAISTGLDEPLDLFHGLQWQAGAQIELGEIAAAGASLREQRRIAERIGDRTASWLCECMTSVHLALRGELTKAEAAAQHAVELAQQSDQPDALPFYLSQLASIRWQQGRLPELAPLLTEALELHPGLPAFRSLAVLANALAGRQELAREILLIDTSDEFAGLPVDPLWSAAVATYAHAIAELADPEAAAKLYPLIEPHRGRLACTSISVWGLMEHALGRLELLLGQESKGRRSLIHAIESYGRLPAPVWRAQAAVELATGTDRAVAEPEVDRLRLIAEAHRIAKRQGAGLVLAAARAEDRDGGPDLELALRIERLELTARQGDIVELIAVGKSNSEIAAELQISASTVKRHLENIYDRTGARSRGALAALLIER